MCDKKERLLSSMPVSACTKNSCMAKWISSKRTMEPTLPWNYLSLFETFSSKNGASAAVFFAV